MKCRIKFDARRPGNRETIEIDFDTKNPKNIWIEVLADPDVKNTVEDRFSPRTYRLVVGRGGGLTLK